MLLFYSNYGCTGRTASVAHVLARQSAVRIGIGKRALRVLVGSDAGAVARRIALGSYPGFPPSCPFRNFRDSVSNVRHIAAACGFTVLRAPAQFATRVMRHIKMGRLPKMTADARL